MTSHRSGESQSLWHKTEIMPTFPALNQNLDTDVCIVGGGIGGILTAYMLIQEGKQVCLIESSELASGQTGRTSAHFSNVLDERYFELERKHGSGGARRIAESHAAALDKIESIVKEEKITCGMEQVEGYLFAYDSKGQRELEREFEACHRFGLANTELLEELPFVHFNTAGALRFPKQLQLHPTKFLSALAKSISARGGKIFTHTHVTQIKSDSRPVVIADGGLHVTCSQVVVATNSPINDLFAIHTKQAPYRTYAMAFQIPTGSFHKALYWDTLDPYHYVRIHRDEKGEVLIVGGEDHKTGQDHHTDARHVHLEEWARKHFPMIQKCVARWSGQVMESIDGLGFLGHNPMDRDNVYVITGDCGTGLTHCTVGAMLITDQIMGRENPWEDVYNPSRIPLKSSGEFLRENLNVAAQYGDWLLAKPKPDLQDLPRGQGVVFREGLKMIAAYKDERGHVEHLSAACPHLGGVVSWNKVEKTWDCPCHGSRFDCHGKVLEGPTTKDLKHLDLVHEDDHSLEHYGRPSKPEENATPIRI